MDAAKQVQVVDLIAQEINEHHERATQLAEMAVTHARGAIEEVVRAGIKLQDKKAEFKNGAKFDSWIESSLTFSRTTAYRYIAASSHYLRAKRINADAEYESVKALYIAAGIMPAPTHGDTEKLERHPFATLIEAERWAIKRAESLLPDERSQLAERLKPLVVLYHQLVQA